MDDLLLSAEHPGTLADEALTPDVVLVVGNAPLLSAPPSLKLQQAVIPWLRSS